VTLRSNRRLVLVAALLLAVSTMFPIVAAVVQPDPTPLWAGIADVGLAVVICACGLTIATRATERFDDHVVRSAFRSYRAGATALLTLTAVFFIAGDRIGWHILLPGLAWRAWLLAWVLPGALSLWRGQPRS
jgi:xanthine/uracil permease